jgi:hypothetical protein
VQSVVELIIIVVYLQVREMTVDCSNAVVRALALRELSALFHDSGL